MARTALQVAATALLAAALTGRGAAQTALGVAVVENEAICTRVGAPKEGEASGVNGCDWNLNVLEPRHFSNSSCEPSQAWLESRGLLSVPQRRTDGTYEYDCDLPKEQCKYNAVTQCLPGASNGTCYTPPLRLLQGYVERLVQSFPLLFYLVETVPAVCASLEDNVTCVASEGCVWNPTNLSKTRPGSEDEVQTVSVVQQVEPQQQRQRVQLTATPYERNVVTLTVMAREPDAVDLEDTTFQLVFGPPDARRLSNEIPLTASAGLLEAELAAIGANRVTVTEATHVASLFGASDAITTSWEITFGEGKADADQLELRNNAPAEDATPSAPPSAPPGAPIQLTRHRHNKQRLILWSNGPVLDGNFILEYKTEQGSATEIETETIAFNADETEVREALLQLTRAAQPAISFVAVSLVVQNNSMVGSEAGDVSMEAEAGVALLEDERDGLQPWRVWDIVFAREVAEFERGELLLKTNYKAVSCGGCVDFEVEAPPGEAGRAMLEVTSLVKAPKIAGSLGMGTCRFRKVLPGLGFPVVGSTLVPLEFQDGPIQPLPAPGSFVRLAGSVQRVAAAEANLLALAEPFSGVLLPRTGRGGVRVVLCERDARDSLATVPVEASGEELTSLLLASAPALEPNATLVVPRNELNEVAWDVYFGSPLNSLDPLIFSTLAELGWTAEVTEATMGRASMSGTFRLAFAGYDGNASSYYEAKTTTQPPFLPGTGAMELSDSTEVVQYTRPLPFDASADEVATALEELGNIQTNGLFVSRSFGAVAPEPGTNRTLDGYTWRITFSSAAIVNFFPPERLFNLSADVPQLDVFDDALQGSDAQVQILTQKQGSGNLSTHTDDTEYVLEEGRLNSPCVANETLRDARIMALGIESSKLGALHELDANMKRCAGGIKPDEVWNGEEECKRVLFEKSTDPDVRRDLDENLKLPDGEGIEDLGEDVIIETASTEPSFCVWRGRDELVADLPPQGPVDPEQVILFNWDKNTYGGTSGLTRFSNCSVPLVYQAQQLLKLFGLSSDFVRNYTEAVKNGTVPWASEEAQETLADVNGTLPDESGLQVVDVDGNLNTSSRLSIFIEQVNKCYEDREATIQIPQPDFINLWQTITIATFVSVAIWFSFASAFFAYRMQKLRILSPQSVGTALLIVLGGAALGCLLGFILGAVPAYILANIYASIPHKLPDESAWCLGAAQGIIILYFDFGRGLRISIRS